jgi:hypothetical protein
MQAASDLCSAMVATIPNPPVATETPPRIKVLVHNGAERLLRPGDYLKVVMVGDPGLEAWWEISPRIRNLLMREKDPGTYLGAYKVTSDDRLPSGRIVAPPGSV